MPCMSDGPSQSEIDRGHLNMLLDELDGKHASGYDADASLSDWARHEDQRPNKNNNDLAVELCGRLTKLSKTKVGTLSLEMQIWWRDHQRFDKRRQAAERLERRAKQLRTRALAKLTPAERKALRHR